MATFTKAQIDGIVQALLNEASCAGSCEKTNLLQRPEAHCVICQALAVLVWFIGEEIKPHGPKDGDVAAADALVSSLAEKWKVNP